MIAKAEDAYEPGSSQGSHDPRPALRVASLSALEEALRRALETASREEVLDRLARALPPEATGARPDLHSNVQKVSVSMPTGLTKAVRQRSGAGGFSRYVSDAVRARIQHDLLGDLLEELDQEYGPIPAEVSEHARFLWPDEEP